MINVIKSNANHFKTSRDLQSSLEEIPKNYNMNSQKGVGAKLLITRNR